MAIYRQVQIDFWQDGFILDLNPIEKYFYIYLMTNSKTTQSGVYELPLRIVQTETGYDLDCIKSLIDKFVSFKKIVYDEKTSEVFLVNWLKYNKISSHKVKKCVESEIKEIKSKNLLNLFFSECKRYGYSVCDTSNDTFREFEKLYEENIGVLNGVTSEWLFELSNGLDVSLFKKAIEISNDKGSCNKRYVNGIIKQWQKNNINSLEDLSIYEKSLKDGSGYYESKGLFSKEDVCYERPTQKQLEQIRELC